jgi:lipopolysaccharide biosynthesis glycosyltransferase
MTSEPVQVVMAADDGYARALAVAGRSVIATLGRERVLELSVLDTGISAANRAALLATFADPRVQVRWLDRARELVAGLPTATWISTAAYGRLMIPELLPQSVGRALYLDCDLVARRCVGDLFDSPMDGFVARAVPDMGSAFVTSPWGPARWFEDGRDPSEFNYNSGVFLMDLDLWRREKLGEQALAYIRSDRYWGNMDQEALNAVLGRRIGPLDPHWNQQAEIFQTLYAVALPYPAKQVESVINDPWIVHYSLYSKPWMYGCEHPWLAEWLRHLDQTAFSGWRPAGPTRRQVLLGRARKFVGKLGRRARIL